MSRAVPRRGGVAARLRAALVGVAAVAVPLASRAARAEEGTRPVDFNRDIRPILSDRCFACHGPDVAKRQAGLRLDTAAGATAELPSGLRAVVPGDAAASVLFERIASADADIVMPPPHVGKPVTAAEAALLRRWIEAGAPYRGHWAFERVERPAIPQPLSAARPRTPVDAFILARLEAEGMRPAEEADRATLARRVSLDLTGLTPTPEQVAAFVADTAPDAYERYVDAALASPHFGERMALEWLDAARYADSHGYQTDSGRSNWPWRDWVIGAFNAGMPFDEFTIQQLAGDMLPPVPGDAAATRGRVVATGFNRNHRINGEGGIIAEEWRVETIVDRVETTGQTWLGLSVGCARCHDHKYDPLSQREFYSLFALFGNVPETGMIMGSETRSGGNSDPLEPLPTPAQEAEIARLERAIGDAEAAIQAGEKDLAGLVADWERSVQGVLALPDDPWQALEPETVSSRGGASFRRLDDGSWLVEGAAPALDVYEITAALPPGGLGGVRLELLADPSLSGGGGFGRAHNGNVVVNRIEAAIDPPGDAAAVALALARAEADYEQQGWPAASVLGSGPGWAIDGHLADKRQPRRIALFPAARLDVAAGARLRLTIRQEVIQGHAFGRFRLAFAPAAPELLGVAGVSVPAEIRDSLRVDAAARVPEQREKVLAFYRERVGGPVKQAVAARDAAAKALAEYRDALPSAMVMREGPPREAFVLERGEYDKPGEKVEPGLPAFLPPLPPEAKPDRLALAEWLVSRDHPLTARVWVNRQWERIFGTGLVKTSENLGSQGEFPSHPELLDWLAATFMEGEGLPAVAGAKPRPWDMKAFLKLLLTSAVYRQSARVAPEALVRDPANRLLGRFPRTRLPGEIVRDRALAAAGLLVPTIGGPSVRPWMPDGVWDDTSRYGNLRGYVPDAGPGRFRRSMYTVWKRTAGPPTMLLFDAPNRETCTVKRSRTNTPLQSLALLNEPTFLEAAAGLARRMVAEGADDEARLARGFTLAVGRAPDAAEVEALHEGLVADRATFTADPAAAERFAMAGAAGRPLAEVTCGMPAAEFAPWCLAANVILNLDEFVMRE
ncbi:MAG: PSD1 and planctomycete cytochrome C domain-containing protein [Planctomycetaceae bacterium]